MGLMLFALLMFAAAALSLDTPNKTNLKDHPKL